MERYLESSNENVNRVIIGALQQEGGSRTSQVIIGGQNTLPFYLWSGSAPNPPALALEIADRPWPETSPELERVCGEVWQDPVSWAKKAVAEWGAQILCLRLISTHPDQLDASPQEAAQTVKKVLAAVGVPLIVKGPGVPDKDAAVLAAVAEAARGENLLLGGAGQENYRKIAEPALKHGHCLIAESPIDINLAKQINILISDTGFPLERIVMDPTTGGLGYGLEYTYSIMERARLAALSGDKTLALPFISFIGFESWRSKEAKTQIPGLGDLSRLSVNWETCGATSMLLAGADLLALWHPQSLKNLQTTIDKFSAKPEL